VAFAADRDGQEALGLPGQELVGEALERLAQHDEAAMRGVTRAQVQVAEPALAPARAPLRGQHHEVQRVRGLELEPAQAAAARVVGRVQRLGHQALVARGQGLVVEVLGRGAIGRDAARDAQRRRHHGVERGHALAARPVDQHLAVGVQRVEKLPGQGQLGLQAGHVALAAEALHRGLEGQGAAVGSQRDGLAVEDQAAGRQRAYCGHQLGHCGRDVVELPGVDAHLVVILVRLHARAVELALERGLAQASEYLADARGRPGQHGQHRAKQGQLERGQPAASRVLALAQDSAGHGREITGQHVRAPDLVDRQARGFGHGLDHEALERALAQLAQHQAAQE
jgi:hypothetical protein